MFFALAVAVSTLLGAAAGGPRAGLRSGVVVGLGFAAFAYLFVRPANEEDDDGNGANDDGRSGDQHGG